MVRSAVVIGVHLQLLFGLVTLLSFFPSLHGVSVSAKLTRMSYPKTKHGQVVRGAGIVPRNLVDGVGSSESAGNNTLRARYNAMTKYHNVPMQVPRTRSGFGEQRCFAFFASVKLRLCTFVDAEGLATIEDDTSSTPTGFLNPRHLFPCHFQTGFTTHPPIPGIHTKITHFPLGDANMGVTRVTGGVSRNIVDTTLSYGDTKAWEAFYPEGSINPGNANAPRGGFGWYMAGPGGEWAFDTAKEIMFSYAVMFEPGFEFKYVIRSPRLGWMKSNFWFYSCRQGGKLPGPYGGTTAEIAYGCSGGRQDGRDQCFSLRLMWRENGGMSFLALYDVV